MIEKFYDLIQKISKEYKKVQQELSDLHEINANLRKQLHECDNTVMELADANYSLLTQHNFLQLDHEVDLGDIVIRVYRKEMRKANVVPSVNNKPFEGK